MPLLIHRNDLRIHDHPTLAAAAAQGEVLPVAIIDEGWISDDRVSDARIRFYLDSLRDLNRQYVDRGSHLSLRIGTPRESITTLLEDHEHECFIAPDANRLHRDDEAWIRDACTTVPVDGVRYTAAQSRDGWDQHLEAYFEAKQAQAPSSLPSNPVESTITLDTINEAYSIDPDQTRFGQGGRQAGKARLEAFIERIESYSGCLSPPAKAENGTSHLSPYIRYGTLSMREIYQSVQQQIESEEDTSSAEMFLDRLGWHQHFQQKLEDNRKLDKEAINPVFRDLHRESHDEATARRWKNGMTGYPLVDAAMRALVATGWLPFRMRAMVASFYSYILRNWWKDGADFFYRQLIDADVAINYYQWQMQSGLIGVHANRIYDPMKQVEENDPNGTYIRRYVPELEPVPDAFIARPWTMPEHVQEETGVHIGRDYPAPIVDYAKRARQARRFFRSKAAAARKAFENDDIWRKASLSSKHDREAIINADANTQAQLDKYL